MPLWLLLAAREWRQHPARHALAMGAVALGVALAGSVHLINRSALAEFGAAVRAVNGEPDLVVEAASGELPDTLFDRLVTDPAVAAASPLLEVLTYAAAGEGERSPVRLLGVDALRVAALAPALLPRPDPGAARLAFLDPELAFVNAAARALRQGDTLRLQSGPGWVAQRVAGSVAAGGTPLVVMDLSAAQRRFGREGRLTRIALRLQPGADLAAAEARWALPAGVRATPPDAALQRVSNLSRAYRVNLTVLAGVALFVGGFLVYSVVSLSVAQRTPSLALLGVLGMTAGQRRAGVLAETALLGLAGGLLGLAGAVALAAAVLRWLAGDLGGGYFPGVAPRLQLDAVSATALVALGVVSALAGAWRPARAAQALAPAQALKGLGLPPPAPQPWWVPAGLALAGVALALLPPVAGLPLAAYGSVAALLLAGVVAVPGIVQGLLRVLPPPRGALVLLARRRAEWQRGTATAAVAGVVTSLALAVALTVMVASFRDGVARWLDQVLPADLYARTAGASALAEQAWLPADFAQHAAAQPGVQRVAVARTRPLPLAPGQPPATLVARELGADGAALPLLATPRPLPAGEVGVFVSEAVVALHGAGPGSRLLLPLRAADAGGALTVFVRGVWRDYARQFGTVAIELADYRRLTGDERINELALWLAPGADAAALRAALRAPLADAAMLEFADSAELRRLSLRIFDRSFAVTYYLQAVAIAVGLVGVAASLSAQVLARRKEFGLLAHLGLTRRQVLAVVAGETAAWVAAGIVAGLLLGVAVGAVLVYVVNPQSFHWTMELVLPLPRLAALAAAVAVAGVATAALAARQAVGAGATRAVREDW